MWRCNDTIFSVKKIIIWLLYLSVVLLILTLSSMVIDLEDKNTELQNQIEILRANLKLQDCKNIEPNLIYEKSRRRLIANIQFFWKYFQHNIVKFKKFTSNTTADIVKFEKMIREYKITWLRDLEELSRNDGYDQWRKNEALELSKIIKQRFENLQNPKDCSESKIFKCYAFRTIGYGGILHEIAKCFSIAYSLNRTMIFDDRTFRYTKRTGFLGILEPFSNSCTQLPNRRREIKFRGKDNKNQILYYDLKSRSNGNTIIRQIPSDLSKRLEKLTYDPLAFWYAQIIATTIKYSPNITEMLSKMENDTGFKHPIVGVHIRRTDKLKLARATKFKEVEDYMSYVEDYYDGLELYGHGTKRRIYLATEEPKVIIEVKQKYPNFEVISNIKAAKIASRKHSRFSAKGLIGIIADLHMLTQSDFVVCTFSSNICELLLEYFYSKFPDAQTKLVSLDRFYWTDYEFFRYFVAILNHTPTTSKEIAISIGDKLKANLMYARNGLFQVENLRTKEKGLVPAFKIEVFLETFGSS